MRSRSPIIKRRTSSFAHTSTIEVDRKDTVDAKPTTDERELIRRMLAGDERAFSAFFSSHFARLYRFALPRLNGEVDAAREVVQATLSKAMRKLADYRGEAALFTWLCQICRREIVDHLRARHRYAQRVVLIDDSPELRAV